MRLFTLLFLAAVTAGCIGAPHDEPPKIVGERTNSQGEVVQRIIRETTVTPRTVMTPDGPRQTAKLHSRFFVQDSGQPKRRFLIGNSATNQFLDDFLAVSNSHLWVTFHQDLVWDNRAAAAHIVTNEDGSTHTSQIGNDFHIYVFDDEGFFRRRTFIVLQRGEGKFLPEDKFPHEGDVRAENGNRTIIFRAPAGLKKYEVLSDSIVDEE